MVHYNAEMEELVIGLPNESQCDKNKQGRLSFMNRRCDCDTNDQPAVQRRMVSCANAPSTHTIDHTGGQS
jgi:hypothetical protein